MTSEQTLLQSLNSPAVASAVETGGSSDFFHLLVNLVIVIALIVVVLRLLKPLLMQYKGVSHIAPGQRIQVHHSVMLGGGHSLHTVTVGEQSLLIGTGPQGSPRLIQLLPEAELTGT